MLRWLTALTLLACLIVTCSYALWHYYARQLTSKQSQMLPITALISPSPPDYVPEDLLSSTLRRAGLPEYVGADPQQQFLILRQWMRELESSAWVKSVHYRDTPSPHLEIKWSQVVPITFRSRQERVLAQWLANENAVLLAPITPARDQAGLPVYIYTDHLPALAAGKSLPSAFARACALALFLAAYRAELSLQAILVGHDPLVMDIRLQTVGGSIVLWQQIEPPDSVTESDSRKLQRLLKYVRVWKSLDKPAGPYFFDNRFAESLLRRPLP